MSERASIALLAAVLVGSVVEIVELHRQLRLLERALPEPAPQPERRAPAVRHLRLVPAP